MNPEFPFQLAAKIKANPSLFEDMDDALLGELLFHYVEGELNAEDAAEVQSVIHTNAKAKAIHQRILEADRFSASEEGRVWLESLANRVLPTFPKPPRDADPASTLIVKLIEFIFGAREDGLELAGAMGAPVAVRRRHTVRDLSSFVPQFDGLLLSITSEERPRGYSVEFTLERKRSVSPPFPVCLRWQVFRDGKEIASEKLVFKKMFSKQRHDITDADASDTWEFSMITK